MSTGASPRPTASRSAATSARTWSGSRQLRWKRMNPSGSASRKNARSAALSSGPAQPKMTASGSRLDKEAPDTAALQLVAGALRRCRVGHGPGLDTIEDAAVAEIDSRRAHAEPAQHVLILLAQPLPLFRRRFGRTHRAELQAIALAQRCARRRRRGGRRQSRDFRLLL